MFSILVVKVKDSKTNLFVFHSQRSLTAADFQSSEVNYMYLPFASSPSMSICFVLFFFSSLISHFTSCLVVGFISPFRFLFCLSGIFCLSVCVSVCLSVCLSVSTHHQPRLILGRSLISILVFSLDLFLEVFSSSYCDYLICLFA